MQTELAQTINEFYCLFHEIKREVKQKNKVFYERWKAGGFLIDEDIVSMYPCLSDIIDLLDDD
jgi:hypothetical protein